MEELKEKKLLELLKDDNFKMSANRCKDKNDFMKLLKTNGLEVTEKEVDDFIKKQIDKMDKKDNIQAGNSKNECGCGLEMNVCDFQWMDPCCSDFYHNVCCNYYNL